MRKLTMILTVLALASAGLAKVTLLSELSHIHSVSPGDVVEGTLSVRNPGEADAQVRIYQTDYLFAADGSNAYGEPGSVPRSNAPWIELGASEVVVPPGETIDVAYRVRIPGAGDLVGSYWSMIMVEEIATDAADAPENGVSVRTVLRYGVQVVTQLGDSGERMLAFVSPDLSRTEAGATVLRVHAENQGERMLRSRYWVELYDEAGVQVARVDGEPLRTYPGTSVRQVFDLGVLPAGSYTALVIADGGGEDVFGAQYTFQADAE